MAQEYCHVGKLDMDFLRQLLFGAAKWRWSCGVFLGYITLVIVPVALWLDYPRWIGLSIAATATVLGTCLRWWSASFRGHADSLLRNNDLLSIGHPHDPELESHIMATHPRIVRRAQRNEVEEEPYHDAQGSPSPNLLVERMRESAWWTEKLATKARKWSYGFGCAVAIVVPVSFVSADSMEVRAYAMAILIIVLVDIFHLGFQYGQLAKSCSKAFSSLHTLLARSDLTEREALIETSGYQAARDTGPLIPGWIWLFSRCGLQRAWAPLSATDEEG